MQYRMGAWLRKVLITAASVSVELDTWTCGCVDLTGKLSIQEPTKSQSTKAKHSPIAGKL